MGLVDFSLPCNARAFFLVLLLKQIKTWTRTATRVDDDRRTAWITELGCMANHDQACNPGPVRVHAGINNT
jgi:hypothetical protein